MGPGVWIIYPLRAKQNMLTQVDLPLRVKKKNVATLKLKYKVTTVTEKESNTFVYHLKPVFTLGSLVKAHL